MSLQVLVSTMFQNKEEALMLKMNINSNAVVINQCGEKIEETRIIAMDGKHITWVNSPERGLSKSRNLAIKNSDADICLIADDDMIYIDNYEEIVVKVFKDIPEADLIAFQVEGIERQFKAYSKNKRRVKYIQSMRLASVEIAFRRSRILQKGISFCEDFGAGSTYSLGEENIFLYDCLNKGLKIFYVPIKIADIHLGNSSWFTGYDSKYFFNKGATFTRMNKMFSVPLILQFAIRKYSLYKRKLSIFKVCILMLKGRRSFLDKRN